jgi:outer membrane protein assembly factor BamB
MMENAYWPMIGQCVTRMAAAPFAGPTAGKVRWAVTMPGVVRTVLVLPSGDLVVSWTTGLGIVSQADGTVTKTLDTGPYWYGVALGKGGRIIAGRGGDLFAWDASSLMPIWGPRNIGTGDMVGVFVYADTHALAVETGGNFQYVDSTTGLFVWQRKVGNTVGSLPVLDFSNNVLGFDAASSYYRLSATSGSFLTSLVPQTHDDNGDPTFLPSGLIAYGSIDGVVGMTPDGVEMWKTYQGSAFPGDIATDAKGRVVTVGPGFGSMAALDGATGAEAWKSQTTAGFGVGIVSDSTGAILASSDDSVVRAFDAVTGTELWSVPSGAGVPPTSGPALAPGVLYEGFDATLVAIGQ